MKRSNFKVREEPFGLSLSKPLARGAKLPFDKLRANGGAHQSLLQRSPRHAHWSH
jgi:hypothetical protein